MCKRFVAAVLLVTAMFAATAPTHSDAKGVPTCQGKPATQWLTSPGILYSTTGDDVLVGSNGVDQFYVGSFGGADLICGNGGNDYITVAGSDSVAYGGTGNDELHIYNGATGYGESGDDRMYTVEGNADGGAGDDYIEIMYESSAHGQAGNDEIYANDTNGSTSGDIYGGPGNDDIYGEGEFGIIDCGQNNDILNIDGPIDTVKRCEETSQPN